MSVNRTDQAGIGLEPILQSHLAPPSYSSAPASTTASSRRNSQDELLGSAHQQNESRHENSDQQVSLDKRELIGMAQTVGQVVKLWAFEVLTLIAAVLVLVGLVLLLLEFDGIRQPEWPEWINLSTIVSMFLTTLRTMLAVVITSVIGQEKWIWLDRVRPLRHLELFEQASQGPWGSFALLFRAWTAHLVSLGAILMVVSLAIGSFMQQTLRTSVCQKPSDRSLGTVAIATRAPMNDLIRCGVRSICASPGLRAAIVGGIIDPASATASVTFDCPTGNCTFQEQLGVTSSSIAYCSACNDMTESIEEVRIDPDHCTPYPGPGSCHYHRLSLTSGNDISVKFYDTDLRMSVGSFMDDDGTTGFGIIAFTLAGCLITKNPGLATVANCSGTPELGIFPNLPQQTNIMAAKCYIFPCLRNYHSTVVNGRLHETVVSTVRANGSNGRLSHNNAIPSKDVPVVKLPCIVDEKIYDATNISMVPPLPTRNFTALWQDGRHLVALGVHRMLNGSCGTTDFSQIPPADTICPQEHWTLAPLFGGGVATLSHIEGFFENMTLAITNRLRNTGAVVHDAWTLRDYINENATSPGSINGTAWETMVCTHVEWAWISFPAALTASTAVLLVCAIWKAVRDREHRPVWKASALPLLFHGPPRQEENVADHHLSATKEMERAASLMRVKLGKGEVDMSLVDIKQSPGSSQLVRALRHRRRSGQNVTELELDSLYEQQN
ncbi:hypothetical protein LA080_004202 [Diaporthe eres]|nr:hypothetical protein LA080_004202 [Diaporthe eres]